MHQNFPGQYLHIVRRLASDPRHEVTFLSNPNGNHLQGVRRVDYVPIRASTAGMHPDAVEFESAMIRAQSVANTARQLASLGYRPDVMLGHNGWGEVLNLRDVWPQTPLIPYFEFCYHERGLDVDFDPEFPIPDAARTAIRARNAINMLGLMVAGVGQTPTHFQHSTYPAWARELIWVTPEGVDLALCRPDRTAAFVEPGGARRWRKRLKSGDGRLLVTYVARNLEPYRGFHIFMRALPLLLAARSDVDVVIAGGDEVSYGARPVEGGSWRERLLAEMGDLLPPGRVLFVGKLPYEDHLSLLKASTVHVYLTYPFVASWSLREAMACGCAIVASETAPVREFIRHDETGWLVPFHDQTALADSILLLLGKASTRERLGVSARRFAEQHLTLDGYYVAFDRLIDGVLEK